VFSLRGKGRGGAVCERTGGLAAAGEEDCEDEWKLKVLTVIRMMLQVLMVVIHRDDGQKLYIFQSLDHDLDHDELTTGRIHLLT
jgi:hypothetical protein